MTHGGAGGGVMEKKKKIEKIAQDDKGDVGRRRNLQGKS